MDKQTAKRLLDEMPEGTTHAHVYGNYFKRDENDVYIYGETWLIVTTDSLAMQQYHVSLTVEQLREIATVTRDEALQWCVDNVKTWGGHDGVTPDEWEWRRLFNEIVLTNEIDQITESEWSDEMIRQRRINISVSVSPTFTIPDDDPVHQPKHYEVIEGLEAIEVIASSLTRDEWKGYCVGNILKYRLRAGKKDDLEQDIRKADEYEMLFNKYKELNRR